MKQRVDMENLRCIDPELIIPIARLSTEVFKTGTWDRRRPLYQEKISPCRATCPVGNNIPEALHRVEQGDFDGALTAFLQENPLPGVCGSVCYHLCQNQCNRDELDGSVNIRALERLASNLGVAKPGILTDAGRPQPIAVVGSGPTGLAAAYHLARMGHPVTLIEAQNQLGGMLRWGIPEFRLPQKILEQDLERILSLGIEARINTQMDEAMLREIKRTHRAVFLALGAQKSRSLDIPGMELDGVLMGLDFLKELRRSVSPRLSGKVLVIGGGNVSIDVAMSARRLGADHVELVCLEQLNEMPAHEWERQDALEEGVIFNNGWGPKKILGKKGRITKVEFMRCMSVFDDQGRFNPSYDPTTTLMRDADWMILAIGQSMDLSSLDGDKAFRQEPGGTLHVNSETLETSVPGIFAGGDAVQMPGSVVDALAAGKRAAVGIHMSLNRALYKKPLSEVSLGAGPSFSIEALFRERTGWDPKAFVRFADLDSLYLEPKRPAILPRSTPVERVTGFQEINLSLSQEEGIREAGRCFFCGTCIGCDLCLLLCPDVCIAPPHEEHDNYWPDPDYCKGCGVCAAVCVRGVVDMSEGT